MYLNLRQVLQYYIEFREEVVRRRAEFDLKKARARLEVLEGLRIAIDNLDRVIQIIRGSADVEEARIGLISEFSFTLVQAQAILDMQLRRLAALEREKLENEYKELLGLVQQLEALLADPSKVKSEVIKETHQLKRKYGSERRTVIHQEELGEFKREDIEPHEDVVITLTHGGYIKRVKLDTYRKQHRGGKGVSSQRLTRADDITGFLQVADTHDTLLFFTDHGRVYSSRVYELPPDQSRQSRGTLVHNLGFNIGPGETVRQMMVVSDMHAPDTYLALATKHGDVKRMTLDAFANINRAGLNCYKLKPKEELISVAMARDDDDLIMVTQNGQSIRFPSSDITSRSRIAGGVRGIRLDKDDEVVGMDVVDDEGYLLIIGTKGRGKLSALRHYRVQGRGGRGIITLSITRNTGDVAAATVIDEALRRDDTGKLMILTSRGQIVRTTLAEIRETGRSAQGVKIVSLDQTDSAAAIAIAERT